MALAADRYTSRADTLVFLGCVLLSLAAMSLPDRVRDPFAAALQRTVLAPFLTLQRQTDLVSASLQRYDAVLAQRDSAALAATFLPELRSENARLRGLLGLGVRLRSGYIPAEVLHQADPTNTLTFLVSAGAKQGVKPLSAVVSPEGLVGMVATVDDETSVVVTWAIPSSGRARWRKTEACTASSPRTAPKARGCGCSSLGASPTASRSSTGRGS